VQVNPCIAQLALFIAARAELVVISEKAARLLCSRRRKLCPRSCVPQSWPIIAHLRPNWSPVFNNVITAKFPLLFSNIFFFIQYVGRSAVLLMLLALFCSPQRRRWLPRFVNSFFWRAWYEIQTNFRSAKLAFSSHLWYKIRVLLLTRHALI